MGRKLEEFKRKKEEEIKRREAEEAKRREAEEAKRREEEEDSLAAGAPERGSRDWRGQSDTAKVEMKEARQMMLEETQEMINGISKKMLVGNVDFKKANGIYKVEIQKNLDKWENDRIYLLRSMHILRQPMAMNEWLESKENIEKWIAEWQSRGFRALNAYKELSKFVKLRFNLVSGYNSVLKKMLETGILNDQMHGILKSIEILNAKIEGFEDKFTVISNEFDTAVVEAPLVIFHPVDHCMQHFKAMRYFHDIDSMTEVTMRNLDNKVRLIYDILMRYLSEVNDAFNKRFGGEGSSPETFARNLLVNFKMPTGVAKPLVFLNLDMRGLHPLELDIVIREIHDLKAGVNAAIEGLLQPLPVGEWDAGTEEREAWIDEWQKRGERLYLWDIVLNKKIELHSTTMNKLKLRQDDAELLEKLQKHENEMEKSVEKYEKGEALVKKQVEHAPSLIEDPLLAMKGLFLELWTIRRSFCFKRDKGTLDELDGVVKSLCYLWTSHLQNVRTACDQDRLRAESQIRRGDQGRLRPKSQIMRGSFRRVRAEKWIKSENVSPKEQRMRWTLNVMHVMTYNGGPADRLTRAYELDPLGGSLFQQIVAIVPWYDWSSLFSKSYMQDGQGRIAGRTELDWTKSDGMVMDESDCRETVDEFGQGMLARTGIDNCQLYLYRSSTGGRDRVTRL